MLSMKPTLLVACLLLSACSSSEQKEPKQTPTSLGFAEIQTVVDQFVLELKATQPDWHPATVDPNDGRVLVELRSVTNQVRDRKTPNLAREAQDSLINALVQADLFALILPDNSATGVVIDNEIGDHEADSGAASHQDRTSPTLAVTGKLVANQSGQTQLELVLVDLAENKKPVARVVGP